MKLYKLNFILVMMLILTSKILSSTLAMNVTEVSAVDTALIYKWNFNVNNKTNDFDFSLIDNIITEQSKGSKSFTFSSGGSDVDIDYSVKIGMQDLLKDINESINLPLIFRVSSEDVEISDKYSKWFTPKDLHNGTVEEVVIEEGTFEKCDEGDGITLDIEWWWNTSYYVGTPSNDEEYYITAKEDYNDVYDAFNVAENEYENYLIEHNFGEVTDEEGEVIEGFDCPYEDCEEDHEAKKQILEKNMKDLEDIVEGHIYNEYVEYDEKALKYLKDNAVKVLFYINGDQVLPGISGRN